MLPDLYLIRHGETEWNREGRLQGRLDSPLTLKGRAQAADLRPVLARHLSGHPPMQKFSSPQGRALETAHRIFGAQKIRTDPRLCEIDTGPFSGQRLSDLRRDHPQVFEAAGLGWYDAVPGGERLADVGHRVDRFLATLTGPAVIVTHGVTLRVLWLLATGRGMAHLDDEPVVQGAVHAIRGGRHVLLTAQA